MSNKKHKVKFSTRSFCDLQEPWLLGWVRVISSKLLAGWHKCLTCWNVFSWKTKMSLKQLLQRKPVGCKLNVHTCSVSIVLLKTKGQHTRIKLRILCG